MLKFARLLLFYVVWGTALGCFLSEAHANPTVLSTYPANGAGDVSGKTRTVSIAFSEEMGVGSSFTSNWPGGSVPVLEWSEDRTIFYVTRDASVIEDGEIVYFTLNPPGSKNPFVNKDEIPLDTFSFEFTIGQDEEKPVVVSTIPADGATGISSYIDTVVVTFSEAMVEDFSIQNSGSWGPSDLAASPDRRIMYMTRQNASSPLADGETIFITLNPGASKRFRDLAGNYLEETRFFFTIGTQGEPPSVVSTFPENGSMDVAVDLAFVSVTFDQPMQTGHSVYSNFPAYTVSWSDDEQTATLLRNDLSIPLVAGTSYFFTLNKDGVTSFRGLAGVPLAEYSFSFTTVANYRLLKIPENPAQGFQWPYYLSVPNSLGRNTVLLVETNNTGGVNDDWNVHDQAVLNLVKWRSGFAADLDVPLLVPTFPRPLGTYADPPLWLIYTHALDRDSLTTTVAGLERIDLQLMAMIGDAKARLTAMGYAVAEKIFINGYSASGSFANRFTLLHPEMIKAAASGSPGGWPTVPVSTWSSETLNYPVGIADLASLVGQPFNLAAFRGVPQYIYVGDGDENDAVDFPDGFDDADREIIDRLFGDGSPCIVERWPHAEAIFGSAQSKAQFVTYPGVGHTITEQTFEDLLDFFQKHHPGRFPLSHAIRVLQLAAGIDLQEASPVVDINEDGRIGMEDAVHVLQMVSEFR